MPRIAFALNFDADDELASRGPYAPSDAVRKRMGELRAPGLVRDGDVIVDLSSPIAVSARGLVGVAWCPTPRAVRALEEAGAVVGDAPPLEILRRANDRAFAAGLGQTLPHAVLATTIEDVDRAIADPGVSGQWLLKRAFGFAGRGRRKVAAGTLAAPDRAWALASLRDGHALQIEPWVRRLADFALHGFVHRDGRVDLGAPTVQRCDDFGAWLATSIAEPPELGEDERTSLATTTRASGEALARIGYFGPFGVDAFRWEGARGEANFQPRSEINARLSMGWAIGMGPRAHQFLIGPRS